MKNKFMSLLTVIGLFTTTLNAQSANNTVNVLGDLNKDGLKDKIQITPINKEKYELKVFFGQADKSFKLITTSKKAVANSNEGINFSEAVVENGILIVTHELTRGSIVHKYRYQNGKMELIGYTYVSSDGRGTMYTTDFNLSTGDFIEKEEDYENDKVLKDKKSKKMIRPLPAIENVDVVNDNY